jgi:hypothetical protein
VRHLNDDHDMPHMPWLLVAFYLVAAVSVLLLSLCYPAHADTYFAFTRDPLFVSLDDGRLPDRCKWTAIVNGEERWYTARLRLDLMGIELGDKIEVCVACEGEWYEPGCVAAEGGPFIASPRTDPSGDGCWTFRDIVALRRAGMWVWERYKWWRILRQRCLDAKGVWVR